MDSSTTTGQAIALEARLLLPNQHRKVVRLLSCFFKADNRARPPTPRRTVLPLGTMLELMVASPISCSAELGSGARELVISKRIPPSSAA